MLVLYLPASVQSNIHMGINESAISDVHKLKKKKKRESAHSFMMNVHHKCENHDVKKSCSDIPNKSLLW